MNMKVLRVKAKSLTGELIEVIKHKNAYYCTSSHLGYQVFTQVDKCPKGHEYRHYMIDGNLYESTHTNTLNIIDEPTEYNLFNLEDTYD